MGLIVSTVAAVATGLGDQFKEFVTCPVVETEEGTVLVQRGAIQRGPGNFIYSDNVISNGSTIAVPEGMAMMIIENGQIVEFTTQPGTYTFDKGTEPSIFTGKFGDSLLQTIKNIGNRITYAGMAAKDQRVYYVNTKRIAGNKFGSPAPKKITDEKYGMLEVTFFGEYVVQVKDPATLVAAVVGSNSKNTVTYEEVIGNYIKSKFSEKITQALSVVMRKHKVSFGDIGMYGSDISEEMNRCLDSELREGYGLEIVDVAMSDINLTDESMERVSKIDDAKIFSNPGLQSGMLAEATADAMRTAAGNESGAMMGFMGMNMAQNSGATVLGAVNSKNPEEFKEEVKETPEPGTLFKHEDDDEDEGPKFCPDCGTPIVGKFCTGCGKKLSE